MSQKRGRPHKHKQPEDLGARIQQAIAEQRFQHALELARQLYHQSPTPENRQTLHAAGLGRARQLREQGATRDAQASLQSQLSTPGLTEAMRDEIAEELAACGDLQKALSLLGGTANPQTTERLMARAVDIAIQQQKNGRAFLPATLQPDFDRILTAFAQLEAGQDEPMRETLQPISLRSPFLEWKVFLRGLQAYYQNDDARAVENWQRLRPERLPARLAAPLRSAIDPEFRNAQPPELQLRLQKQYGLLQGSPAGQMIRELAEPLARRGSLAPIFRKAEQVVPVLKRDAPQVLPRLANFFYWIVLSQGEPEDVPRYQRVFGSPADDPNFHRLEALAWERSGELREAHRHWQALEKEIAARPEVWPGEQAGRARALIWQRMGRNAASIPDDKMLKELPPFLRNHPDRPQPLTPDAEECFRQCIAIAPDLPDGYRDLFGYLVEKKKASKAVTLSKEMIKRFPDDVPMLTRIGDVMMGERKYAQAREVFQKALDHNPLDRALRRRLGTAELFHARTLTEAGKFDEARQAYQHSLEMEPDNPSTVYCKWAACEIKAGNPERGEELIQQALAGLGSLLAVSFSMVIEAIRLKLPAAVKKRFDASFKQELTAPPDPQAALYLAQTASSHRRANIEYIGQKTHEKKVLDYLRQAESCAFTEAQLEGIGEALLSLDTYRLAKQYLDKAISQYPNNPLFPLLRAEAEIARGPHQFRQWDVEKLLQSARKKAERLSPGPRRDELLDRIQDHFRMLEALNPFGRLFDQFFGGGDPFGGDEFDGEDEDGW